jgi:hypothetical protein
VSYWLKAGIGGLLFVASVVFFSKQLVELLETGTCASGNTPYVTARPCPEGTGTDVMLLMGSVLTGLIGAWIFAVRGPRPGSPDQGGIGRGLSSGALAWAVFFTGSGAYILVASLTKDSLPDDGKLGGVIVGATFLFMGLPVAAYFAWTALSDLRDKREPEEDRFSLGEPEPEAVVRPAQPRPAPTPAATIVPPVPSASAATAGDAIAQIERLQRLRESGALTDAEFEAQKRRILGG